MTPKQKPGQYRSFFLRLWQEGETETSATWHGEIESIQTGQKRQFDRPELIIDFLPTQMSADPNDWHEDPGPAQGSGMS